MCDGFLLFLLPFYQQLFSQLIIHQNSSIFFFGKILSIYNLFVNKRFLTTFLPKNYPPSYNFGPRAGLRGATFGCAFFSLGGSTIRSLSFSVLRS